MPARPLDAKHLQVGRLGEDAAASHLEAKGLRVLERNVCLGRLELDLVCEHQDTLVFVEVKTRAEGSLATTAGAATTAAPPRASLPQNSGASSLRPATGSTVPQGDTIWTAPAASTWCASSCV